MIYFDWVLMGIGVGTLIGILSALFVHVWHYLTEVEQPQPWPVSEMPQLPYCDKCRVHFDFDSCELVEDEGHSYFFCPNCSYLMRVK